jgi:hypothetical protein
MRKSLLLAAAITLGWSEASYAVNLAVITNPPTIFNLLVLLAACTALAICFRVMTAVKGGHLSRSWQLFVAGFAVLAVGQLVVLMGMFEVFAVPAWVGPALMVVWIGVFLYGVTEAKRILG